MTVRNCQVISLPKIADPRGSLTFIEAGEHIPFEIRRVYYLYDLPNGAERGGHAHHQLEQLMIAVAGSFDVLLDDGANKKRVRLSLASEGLYVASMIWREMENFSPAAVCLVLASDHYDEADYYRNYDEFVTAVNKATRR